MLLHNQTKHKLEWIGAGRPYNWEPYGACEIPEEMVQPLLAQKFPVGLVQVTPERKASAAADDERAAVRSDEVLKLREALATAEADARTARDEVRSAEERRTQAEARSEELSNRCNGLQRELEGAQADAKAAEDLLRETTQKLELAEASKRVAANKKTDQRAG